MTRLALSLALVASLSSLALAHRRPPPRELTEQDTSGFAQAPQVMSREAVRAALAQTRANNLAAFRAYVKAGVFPSNVYKDSELNVWRDQGGHYCAAATIILRSGQAALVASTAEQNNFIRLADVRQGPLMDWILTSGFTQDELVMIQRPFRPVTQHTVIEPAKPILVDAGLRKAETARLLAKYAEVDKQLAAAQQTSLDAATDRLMQHPELAARYLASAQQRKPVE